MLNIVILISGSGSNMAAIIRTAKEHHWAKHLNARVSAVISNKADAEGLAFAQQHGIATAVVDHKAFAGPVGGRCDINEGHGFCSDRLIQLGQEEHRIDGLMDLSGVIFG